MAQDRDPYALVRDWREAQRLNAQHRVYMQCQGYYLHPAIEVPSNARIAELATGTAIFLNELATANTGYECHGFDVSDAMFPAASSIAPNVRLLVHDVKVSFAEMWHGYFDVVHIRFLQCAMKEADWATVLKNAIQLLKPGGTLQWCENDTASSTKYALRSGPPTATYPPTGHSFVPARPTGFRRIYNTIFPPSNPERVAALMYGINNLSRLMSDSEIGNLGNVLDDAYSSDARPELRKAFSLMSVEASISLMKGAFGEKALQEQGVDLTELEAELRREVESGVYIRMT